MLVCVGIVETLGEKGRECPRTIQDMPLAGVLNIQIMLIIGVHIVMAPLYGLGCFRHVVFGVAS